MNILITGAFGFVGTSLSKDYKKSLGLIGIDIAEPHRHQFDRFTLWDDLEKIELEKIDTVIHLAGKAHDTKNISSGHEYFDINVGLTKKIFSCFLKSSATKFIFFSSVKAAADSVNGDQLAEDEEPNPQTPYGKSKLEAERYILEELENWRKSEDERVRKCEGEKGRIGENENVGWREDEKVRIDKKVYILRPCMIHGPGNKGNLNLLYKLSQKGLPWPLGAFENRRSFCSIDNISYVVQQIIEKDIELGVYNVADDEALSTNELIRLISASQGRKAKIWNIPQKPIETFAKVGDFLPLPLNSERLKKLTESYVVSNQKIKNALGIEKMPVSAGEGFRKTFESFGKRR